MAKPGPRSVARTSSGSNPAGNSGGNPGRSMPQRPIPGPASPGQPVAMHRALAKKSVPDRGSWFPGLVK